MITTVNAQADARGASVQLVNRDARKSDSFVGNLASTSSKPEISTGHRHPLGAG